MEYFPTISRTLARIRCLTDSLKCIENKDPLPEALCYVPNYFVYQINDSIKSNWKTVKLEFFKEPLIRVDNDEGTSHKLNVDREDGLVFVESEPVVNECGYWIKVFEVAPSKSKNKKFKFKPSLFFLLQSANSLDIPKLQLVDYKMPSTTATCWRGRGILITSWAQVVEIWYGVTIVANTINKYTVEPNEDLVSCMRTKPSLDWDLRHDEQLVKFLSEHPDDDSRKAGTVWAYVDKIELSSYLDSHEDSVAALTDDNHNTYWESDGSQSLHFIVLHMKNGAVVEKITLDVDVVDDSYMPHKIEIYGCSTKLHEMEIENIQSGEVCVFESADQYYPTIEIRIVECKEEGIDTRIRGLKLRTKNFEPTDLSEKYFSSYYLAHYPLLASVSAKSLYWRAIAVKRLATLFDSVLVYLVPKCETKVQDDFFRLLNAARFLFPLSKRRKSLFDTFIKETERLKSSSTLPKLFVNRRQASENRNNPDFSVFRQIFEGLKYALRTEPVINYRFSPKVEQWWECKFIGEGVIDQGGGFRDSLCDIGDELCPLENDAKCHLPYFIKAANQFEDKCIRDVFVVNPSCFDFEAYEWIGKLIGACLRTKEKLVLSLSKFTWKLILGQNVTFEDDFNTVDRALVSFVDKLKTMSEDNFYHYFGRDHNFSCVLSDGSERDLYEGSANRKLQYENRMEYADMLKKVRLFESKKQIQAIRNGLLKVIPWAAIQLLTWQEFETYVCGNPEISLDALKYSARYEDIDPNEKRVQYLWEALANFSNDERSKFLRFVTGRRRLPTPLFICPDKGDDSLTSNSLPESSTCSNTLFLPNYTSAIACEEKLRYAIFNCLAIDTDMSPWDD